ncbi:hypothetical protein HJFPF1_10432 [Paramyrothecium foliicola]|nr:hypothetical protein HJFPF1_10432 [Paramyrothecium foliicola]
MTIDRRFRLLFITSAVFVLLLLTFFFHGDVVEYVKKKQEPAFTCARNDRTPEEEDMSLALPLMWKDSIHDLKKNDFTTEDGMTYRIAKDAYRWPSLGSKILIVDIDTRVDLEEGGIQNPEASDKKKMKGRTAGYLNHMLYGRSPLLQMVANQYLMALVALIHGYNYRLVHPPEYPDRTGAWVKLPILREALKTYEIVMFLDADAIFEHMNLPLEWLLSHWDIGKDTIVALPEDVHNGANYDDYGRIFWNAGVILAHKTDRTQELIRRWENCPTEEEFKGCSRWMMKWAAEQAAFNNYIRYAYNTSNEVRMIPCNEANGNTIAGGDCQGTLVSHWWHDKEYVVEKLYQQANSCTIYDLHEHFLKQQDNYFLDLGDRQHPLEGVDV